MNLTSVPTFQPVRPLPAALPAPAPLVAAPYEGDVPTLAVRDAEAPEFEYAPQLDSLFQDDGASFQAGSDLLAAVSAARALAREHGGDGFAVLQAAEGANMHVARLNVEMEDEGYGLDGSGYEFAADGPQAHAVVGVDEWAPLSDAARAAAAVS